MTHPGLVLGLLPSIRGGLAELAKTGQDSRLIDGYLRPYAAAFDEVRYFSYLNERLEAYVADPDLLARLRVLRGGMLHPCLYAFLMPLRYRREMRDCSVLRVFQITGVIPALIAKRLFGVPFVTTYGFWYSRLARSGLTGTLRAMLRAIVERAGLAAADAVIVTTPELGRHVGERVSPERIHLIPNGVDTTLFRPMPRAVGEPKTVLYAGRLSEEKNLGAILEAAAEVSQRIKLQVTFIGDGPERPRLEARARQLQVSVAFLPFVEHARLAELMAQADVFVLPSFTEGHPKVLLEAMSCGLPCIASAVGGNLSIVDDGRTGLLFDPAVPGALAACLLRVFASEDFAHALGRGARAEIAARYDLRILVAREIDLLRRVARSRRAP
jgi:glycosyltransferase involved in cell wall biosynthesis